jgi:hypothetical protein
MEHERVDERVDDEVVLPMRLAHEASAIVDVNGDSRILVRMVRMFFPADVIDGWIDFHGVHVLRTIRQCRRDIVARSGADNQHVRERPPAGVAIQQMRKLIARAAPRHRHHLLMPDVVGLDASGRGLISDFVIRRPDGGVDDAYQYDNADDPKDLECSPLSQKVHPDDADNQEPHSR